jgi:hypothetical protein
MGQEIDLRLATLLGREMRPAPDEQRAAARLVVAPRGPEPETAHRPRGGVDELVGAQGRERLVVAGAIGILDGELHLVPLGEVLGAGRTVVLRARRIDAEPGRGGLAGLAEKRVAPRTGRELARGRDAVRRRHAFAHRLRAAEAVGVEPVPKIGMVGARPAARLDGRAPARGAADRAAAPHDGDQVPAVAVRGHGDLAIAHRQRLTLPRHDQALQHVRVAGSGQHRHRGNPGIGAFERHRPLRVVVVELREADRVEDVVGVAEQDAEPALMRDGPAEIGAEER